MRALTLDGSNCAIGEGKPPLVMAGLNVLEDEGLAVEVAGELKRICDGLGLSYIFKASFDKANRSAIESPRGVGLEAGLKILEAVKAGCGVPVVSDIHAPEQAAPVAAIVDVVQIPAFLCRQTDLLVAAAEATRGRGKWLHVKKGQFLAPEDCRHIIAKLRAADPDARIVLGERGTSFGYHNLVVDMLGIAAMQSLGVPVVMDATHAAQLPGAGEASAGGRREGVPVLARAAIAAGADGIFLEFHPRPDDAPCDAPSCLPLSDAAELLADLKKISEAVR